MNRKEKQIEKKTLFRSLFPLHVKKQSIAAQAFRNMLNSTRSVLTSKGQLRRAQTQRDDRPKSFSDASATDGKGAVTERSQRLCNTL
ncbi:hypothetical protein V1478_016573, partial [Vespula squamosa]